MESVLSYWFAGTNKEKRERWFYCKCDVEIREQFKKLLDEFTEKLDINLAGVEGEDALAAIILVDQMAKNIYRGDNSAFKYQDVISNFAKSVIGKLQHLPPEQYSFVILAIIHQEDANNKSIVLSAIDKMDKHNSYFKKMLKSVDNHYNILETFGRYPKRNAVLGRKTTPEEQKYLDKLGNKFV